MSVTRPIEARLAEAGLPPLPRLCWLEIDEAALAGNLAVVRGLAGSGVELSAVVKADAYGHGLEAAAHVFESAGADRLCVAGIDEALQLRAAGITSRVLVLFPVPIERLVEAAGAGVELVVSDEPGALAMIAAWRALAGLSEQSTLRVHLEVETGLSRGGLLPERVPAVARRIIEAPGTSLAGLWTHFASPEDEQASAAQAAAFERAVDVLGEDQLPIPARHVAASGALFAGSGPFYEGVRPGLALYGLLAADLPLTQAARAAAAQLRPAMALKCRPIRIEALPAGTAVSYGGRWRAERPSLIATLPVGYGDGWTRAYAPGARALVRGQPVPLVGSVAMDAVMADVTDVPGVGPADEFVLLGEQGPERITAHDLAHLRNTIAWEVVTTMAQRLPRVYHAGAVLLGVRTLAGEVRGGSPSGPAARGSSR